MTPNKFEILAQDISLSILEAKEKEDNPAVRYIKRSSAIAASAVVAFNCAADALIASDLERTYAKAVFLKVLDSPNDKFKLVCAEDVLTPGQVSDTFEDLDKWFKGLEDTIMPAKARALLAEYGDDVGEEIHEHWKVLAAK